MPFCWRDSFLLNQLCKIFVYEAPMSGWKTLYKRREKSCTIFLIYCCTACVPSLQTNAGLIHRQRRTKSSRIKRLVCSLWKHFENFSFLVIKSSLFCASVRQILVQWHEREYFSAMCDIWQRSLGHSVIKELPKYTNIKHNRNKNPPKKSTLKEH